MKVVEPLASFETIKLLADARRLEILRQLMAAPATLTQLARVLRRSPAWVRHHVLSLQAAQLIEVSEIRQTGKVTEKYYRARVDALLLQELILPKTKKPALIFSGSHDLALEGLSERLSKHLTLLSLPVGSLDGLVNLRQGLCQVAGAHLLDASGEYNTPFVRHLFADRSVELVTLAHRTQGLIVSGGNPKGIQSLADLVRPDVRFINRNAGSGTRLWTDTELRRLQIPASEIQGYDREVSTHTEAAALIQKRKADVTIGLQAAAQQTGLDFLPLFEERYDLVLPTENEKTLSPLLNYLQTASFRSALRALTGYNPTHTGELIAV